MTDLYPDFVPVHPVPCHLDQQETSGDSAEDWPGSPCLIQGAGRERMCLTCGGVDPRDYDAEFHGPDQSLAARRGRVRVIIQGEPHDN